ncbi:MAG: RnfABCDGE type electron transport complex subunit B [Clostridiales bacterium]|nr:RnfABCDGE type electron transport complex subunit B [Clostridiales bacterium]
MYSLLGATIKWLSVLTVLGIIAALAIVFSVLILIVSKVCKIKEDEKVLRILEHLAGSNCGGCGKSGCAAFAKALVSGEADLNDCHVTDAEAKKLISAINGKQYIETEPTTAVVRCNGGKYCFDRYRYLGNPGCENQMYLLGGQKTCPTGCLGGGSCIQVCPEGAITIEDDVAVIDRPLCVSCGACINKCPKNCIERIPLRAPVYIACTTHCKGKDVTTACQKGCIACGICVKKCEYGAITMVDNLPVIDYNKCTGCKVCVERCPRKCIHIL